LLILQGINNSLFGKSIACVYALVKKTTIASEHYRHRIHLTKKQRRDLTEDRTAKLHLRL
jgi:hypothetical protein